jgi:hypothetical protein
MAVGFPAKTNFATGEVLTATNMNDITGTLNLLQQDLYPAGRNKIINGAFNVNQRAFTSTTTTNTYGFDRFLLAAVDGTVTYSAQTFTPGTAPVSGYEATNFAQIITTGQTLTTAVAQLQQKIEDVRTFAGQTATFSFWAKATTGTPNVIVLLTQNFGSGGSPSSSVATVGTVQAITTSWARYSFTIAVPSISGKTVGTTANTSFLNVQIAVSGGSASGTPTVGIQSNTFQIWGIQAENGSTASPFQTATGSVGGELALCQRYYTRFTAGAANFYIGGRGNAASTTSCVMQFSPLATMRVTPTTLDYSNLAIYDEVTAPAVSVATILTATNPNILSATFTSTALTQYRNYSTVSQGGSAGYIGFSAEL